MRQGRRCYKAHTLSQRTISSFPSCAWECLAGEALLRVEGGSAGGRRCVPSAAHPSHIARCEAQLRGNRNSQAQLGNELKPLPVTSPRPPWFWKPRPGIRQRLSRTVQPLPQPPRFAVARKKPAEGVGDAMLPQPPRFAVARKRAAPHRRANGIAPGWSVAKAAALEKFSILNLTLMALN